VSSRTVSGAYDANLPSLTRMRYVPGTQSLVSGMLNVFDHAAADVIRRGWPSAVPPVVGADCTTVGTLSRRHTSRAPRPA